METKQQDRLISVIIGVALIVAAIFWIKDFETSEPVQVTTATTNWQTYTNEEFKFSLQYPDSYTAMAGDSSEYPAGSSFMDNDDLPSSVPVVTSMIHNEIGYEGTNLAGAWITVAVADNMDKVTCEPLPGASKTQITTSTHNNQTWYEQPEGWISEGAAGTTFQSLTSYIAVDSRCYELALHLATTNIGNYDPGTVTAVDEGALRAQLQGVAQTFQITQ